jgi:DNA polymerase I-like protein with 3'-5' exonuclease and polymerase domains
MIPGVPNWRPGVVLFLLPETNRPLGTTTRPGVCASPLTANWHASSVPEAAIASDVHQSLDVHGDFTPQITLNPQLLVDDVTQPLDFIFSEIPNSGIRVNASSLEELLAGVQSNTVDVGETDFYALLSR